MGELPGAVTTEDLRVLGGRSRRAGDFVCGPRKIRVPIAESFGIPEHSWRYHNRIIRDAAIFRGAHVNSPGSPTPVIWCGHGSVIALP